MATDQPIFQKLAQDGKTFEELKKELENADIEKMLKYVNQQKGNPVGKELNAIESILDERKLDRIHDRTFGIYPDVSDTSFAARLARKTEFYRHRSEKITGDPCGETLTEFTPSSIQRLVSRFLHPLTPYNGMLLYHGVGVGKTCSAITVAETFLDASPEKMVYIIAPQAIADGFRRTIFDINRIEPNSAEEAKLTGEKWKSPQCTGMTYLRLLDMANNVNKEEIAAGVDKLIKERYKIMGYRAFANWVEKKLEKIAKYTLSADEKDTKETEILSKLFAGHLFIIDEAHNLRDSSVDETDITISDDPTEVSEEEDQPISFKMSDASEGKKLTPILKKILDKAKGLRLMLMSATPMYNTAIEIVFLLNLLLRNDFKKHVKLLEVSKIFDNTGKLIKESKDQLISAIQRYVSYMRGENPKTFPLRLTSSDINIGELFELNENKKLKYPAYSISLKEISEKHPDKKGIVSFNDNDAQIMKALPLLVHKAMNTPIGRNLYEYLKNHSNNIDAKIYDNLNTPQLSDKDVKQFDFILDRTMQMGNIIYDDNSFGNDGWEKHFQIIYTDYRGNKLKQYKWKSEKPIEFIFGDNLKDYSPKIASIVEKVINGQGISFVYSRYVKAGALPIAIALELRGWVRAFADGTTLPLLLNNTPRNIKNKYVILTSDDTISPNFAGLVRYSSTFANDEERNGSKAKVIIGSQVASEGLDLKCIRQIHLLDGWYHLNRIEQIIGRGVRYCSHKGLDIKERNCLIYLHAIHVERYETADLYAYRLASKKAQPIGAVSRLLKKFSWDCILNREANILKDLGTQETKDAFGKVFNEPLADKPYTSVCDFIAKKTITPDGKTKYFCPEYKCGVQLNSSEEGKNKSTETIEDFQTAILRAKQNIIKKFSEMNGDKLPLSVMKVEDALEYFKDEKIEDRSFQEIGLRNIIDNTKILQSTSNTNKKGEKIKLFGTLRLLNNYIVFQPDKVTDLRIPMALRYGRAYNSSYGHMRSTYDNPGIILEPIKKETKFIGKYSEVIEKLQQWDDTITEIFEKSAGPLTKRPLIPSFDKSGWRWLLRHFNKENIKEDARLIALSWFTDNYWSSEELLTVLKHWLEYPNQDVEYSKYSKLFTKSNNRIELFNGKINGCFVYNTTVGETGKLETYCKTRNVIEQCTANLLTDVNSIIGAPIVIAKDKMGKSDTADYLGFLVSKQKTTVFKSADNTKPGNFRGAECANTSNLDNHLERIRGIYGLFEKSSDKNLKSIKDEGILLSKSYNGTKEQNQKILEELQNVLENFEKNKLEDLKLNLLNVDPLHKIDDDILEVVLNAEHLEETYTNKLIKDIEKIKENDKDYKTISDENMLKLETRLTLLNMYKKIDKLLTEVIKSKVEIVKTKNPKRLIRALKQNILKYEFEYELLYENAINDIEDLSLDQACPYMEFLFRYADMKKIDGKRWFLSVVDSARSGIKMT